MIDTKNYARINLEGKLEIETDNGLFIDGKTHTKIANRIFAISGEDLMKIYGLLQDKQITCLHYLRESCSGYNNYMIVGENVENKRIMDMYVNLLKEVEELNNTRHWWERKIKIERTL
jgi:hypothetical protein